MRAIHKRWTNEWGPDTPVHDDLVRRDFFAPQLNEKWFTDVTEHATSEGKVYLFSLMDGCSIRLAGYSVGERMTSDLAV